MLTASHSFRTAALDAGFVVKPLHEVDRAMPPAAENDVLVAVNEVTGVVHGAFNVFHEYGLRWFLDKGPGFNFKRPSDMDAFYARCIEA